MTTIADLIPRVLERANSLGYVDPAALPTRINTSLARLHNFLAGEIFEDYFQRRKEFPIVPYQQHYVLPADYFKMRAVWMTPIIGGVPDYSNRFPMTRIDPTDEILLGSYGVYQNMPLGYAIEDSVLTVAPVPQAPFPGGFCTLFYIPTYTPPSSLTEAIPLQIAVGWEEWVVNDVAYMIAMSSRLPAQDILAEREMFMTSLRKQAKNRDASQPFQVREDGWSAALNPWGDFSVR